MRFVQNLGFVAVACAGIFFLTFSTTMLGNPVKCYALNGGNLCTQNPTNCSNAPPCLLQVTVNDVEKDTLQSQEGLWEIIGTVPKPCTETTTCYPYTKPDGTTGCEPQGNPNPGNNVDQDEIQGDCSPH